MKKSLLPRKFFLQNLEIWNADGIRFNRDVFVKDGIVHKITDHGNFADLGFVKVHIEATQLLPAGVDTQVHLRVPGQAEKETPLTGLRAAAKGGYAAILTMPNTRPVIDRVEVLEAARKLTRQAELDTGVTVLWSAAISRNQEGLELCDLERLAQAGVSAFTDDGKGLASSTLMARAFERLSRINLPLLQHAEVPGHGGILASGPLQRRLAVKAYDECPEVDMVKRDIELLRDCPNARYHVLHVSSRKTIELLSRAKQKGLRVTCEVSPHHLFFDTGRMNAENTSFKMNPPIRAAADREALVAALAAGAIDFVATDHAPHEQEKKNMPFADAAFGTTGLETSLRVLLDLYARKLLSAQRLVEVFSSAPARFLGIDDQYGRLEEGRPFNAVLVDAGSVPEIVSDDDFESLSKNNCFIGERLSGKIEKTFLRQIGWDVIPSPLVTR